MYPDVPLLPNPGTWGSAKTVPTHEHNVHVRVPTGSCLRVMHFSGEQG